MKEMDALFKERIHMNAETLIHWKWKWIRTSANTLLDWFSLKRKLNTSVKKWRHNLTNKRKDPKHRVKVNKDHEKEKV